MAAEAEADDSDRQNPTPGLGFSSPAAAAASTSTMDDHAAAAAGGGGGGGGGGAGEPQFQEGVLRPVHALEDQVSPPPPSSPAAATAAAEGDDDGGAAGLRRRLLGSMSLTRTLSAIGLAPSPPKPPGATSLGLGLLLHLNQPDEPAPMVDHGDGPRAPPIVHRSPSSISSFSKEASGFEEQDDDQTVEIMKQGAGTESGATVAASAAQGQQMVEQHITGQLKLIDEDLPAADESLTAENKNTVDDPAMVEKGITEEIGEIMDDIAGENQEMTVEQCTGDKLGGTENDNAQEYQVAELGAINDKNVSPDGFDAEDEDNAVEQCTVDMSRATKEKDAVDEGAMCMDVIAMKDQGKAMEQIANDELRTDKDEKAVEEHRVVAEQVVLHENVARLCIGDELRAPEDVVTFQNQGNMLEQRNGDEQGTAKGKLAVQKKMVVVDHVCHKWGTTDDGLAVDTSTSGGIDGISSSEVSVTLNGSDCGEVKKKVKLCVRYPQRPGKINCPFYISTGSCSFGLSCIFNHPLLKAKTDVSSFPSEQGDHGVSQILELNRVGLPIREGARNCSYYMRNGTCGYGKKCHFNHPEQVIDAQFDQPTGWENDASPSSQLPKKSYNQANLDDTTYLKNASDNGALYALNHASSDEKSSTLEVLPLNILQMLLPLQKVPPSTEEKVVTVNKDPSRSAASNDFAGCRLADSSGRPLCQQELVNYPERPGRPECPFYMKFGNCKFASACKYHHSKDKFPSRYHSNDLPQGEGLVECPERPGEPECPFYMKNRFCKFGIECKFHHPKSSNVKKPVAAKEHHLATGITQDHMYQQDQYPERPGQPDCRYYMQFGKCKYLSACIFHHPKDRLSSGWHQSEDVLKQEEQDHMCQQDQYPERPGQPDCRYYMQFGKCKYLSACIFHHPKDRLSSGWHQSENILKQEEQGEQSLYPERLKGPVN